MKKNVVFWIGIKSENAHLQEKHGNFKYLDISKKCWEWWCEKNDIVFFPYEKTSRPDTNAHKATWQRWFDIFNFLDSKHIKYDKILMADACSIVKWDCPNFFNLTKNPISIYKLNLCNFPTLFPTLNLHDENVPALLN